MEKKPVIIYTAPGCLFSKQAKEFLTREGIPFVEKDITVDQAIEAEMVAKTGGDKATPALVIGDAVLVGLDEAWVKQQWGS